MLSIFNAAPVASIAVSECQSEIKFNSAEKLQHRRWWIRKKPLNDFLQRLLECIHFVASVTLQCN